MIDVTIVNAHKAKTQIEGGPRGIVVPLRPLRFCNLCHQPFERVNVRIRLCLRCDLFWTLLSIRNLAWQAGQIPLPFPLWRNARSRGQGAHRKRKAA